MPDPATPDPAAPEATPARPPLLNPRLLIVFAAVACGVGAGALYRFGPPGGPAAKPKRPPVTEEWTKPAERPAPPKPVDADDPADSPKEKEKDKEKAGPLIREFDALKPVDPREKRSPVGGAPPSPPAAGAGGESEKVVVRLTNARRVLGSADADNIEVEYEVLRVGYAILKDTAVVKTKAGTTGFTVSAPDRKGTLTIPGAVPARTTGPVEVWLILRRDGKDLTSNVVTIQ